MSQKLLDICICSCQRPVPLRQTLDSLQRMQLPAGVDVAVTVVDNDPFGSAEALVAKLSDDFPVPLHYCREMRRGIPFARNRGIAEAHRKEADYLVFIDDDEWVTPTWLVQLYAMAESLDGKSVVAGRVRGDVPEGTSSVMAEFFDRKKGETGERWDYCATNNVLIPIAVTRDLGLRFDESRPFDGGEDTLFFTEVSARGVEIVLCAEAVVYETIPPERISARWQSRRKYSAGITQALQKIACGRSRVRVLLSGIGQLLFAVIRAPLCLLVGQLDNGYRSWLKICRSAGVVSGAIGGRSEFYKPVG